MFHEKHPQIWGLFVENCFEKINQGFTRFSAKGIIEQIRWKENLTNGKNKLKPGYSLSNDYTCWYARKFIESYPQHREFFELRKRSSANRPPSSEVKVRNLGKNFNDGHSYYLFRVDEWLNLNRGKPRFTSWDNNKVSFRGKPRRLALRESQGEIVWNRGKPIMRLVKTGESQF